jgi:shikimate kinase
MLEDLTVTGCDPSIADRLPPLRIVLTGFMGAGKSTVGVRLAGKLGWTFVDLDEEIVRSEGKTIADIFDTAGEKHFREIEHAALASILNRRNVVLALGGGAIETAANREMLAGNPEVLMLYLEAPLEVLLARCGAELPGTPRRPVLERRKELAGRFERRRPFYEAAHWTVSTTDLAPDAVVETILARWRQEH